MEHNLKCWPEYFRAVKSGAKSFEVRKWDRPYAVGDFLILQEYDPKTMGYTGDSIVREVTYLLDMTYLPGADRPNYSGYVVMGLLTPTNAEVTRQLADMTAQRDALKQSNDGLCYSHQTVSDRMKVMEAERDAAVEDMTYIVKAIQENKQLLSGGFNLVNSLKLGRCDVCKGVCHDGKPCRFEWRGVHKEDGK